MAKNSGQPKTRDWTAISAWNRKGGTMQKRGKGRLKREEKSRQDTRKELRNER